MNSSYTCWDVKVSVRSEAYFSKTGSAHGVLFGKRLFLIWKHQQFLSGDTGLGHTVYIQYFVEGFFV